MFEARKTKSSNLWKYLKKPEKPERISEKDGSTK